MEQMIRECKMGSKTSLGNGWTVENNSACGYKFYKEGVLIDSFIMKASAIDFAEKNCKAEKSEAEMLKEIGKKFFTETKATRKDGSLVIADIVSLSGGDAIRDAGGTRIEFQPVTYEFLKAWAEKNSTDYETVCTAIGY